MGITFELDFGHFVAFLLGMAFCYFLMTYRKSKSTKPPPPLSSNTTTTPAVVPPLPKVPTTTTTITTTTITPTKATTTLSSSKAAKQQQKPAVPEVVVVTTPASPGRRASLVRSNSSPSLKADAEEEPKTPPSEETTSDNEKSKEKDPKIKRRLEVSTPLRTSPKRRGAASDDERETAPATPSRLRMSRGSKGTSSMEEFHAYDKKENSSGLRASDRNRNHLIPKRDPSSMFSDSNIDWDKLKLEFKHPVTGVELRERKKKLGKNKKVFSGTEACDWLVAHVEGGIDRKKAVDIGVKLWASGLFKHVSHRHRPFSDRPNEYFAFVKKKKTKEKEKDSGKISTKSKRLSKGMDEDDDTLIHQLGVLGDSLEKHEAWLEVKETDGWPRRWLVMKSDKLLNKEKEEGLGQEEGQTLTIYDHVLDKTLITLIHQMTSPETGLKIKSRRYLLKTYSKCFSGKKAVDWLVSNKHECETRQHAVLLMNKLMQKGLVSDVSNDKFVFKDSSNWYTFNLPENEEENVAQSENGTPLGHIPLNSQILFKLKKEGSYVFIILYHAENRPIIHTGQSSAREKETPLGKSKSLDVDDLKNFVIRLHEKDESNLKRWIFTFQEAVLIGVDESLLEETAMYDSDDYFSDEDEELSGEEEARALPKEVLSSAEQAVLVEVKHILAKEKESGNGGTVVDYTQLADTELIKFIRARKLEVEPAIALLKAGTVYRKENLLENIKITDILAEMRGGMLRLVPDARDKEGRVVLVILPQYYRPATTQPIALVRAMYYLLDCALENDEQTQRMGFSVLVDCKDSKYANFDAKMPKVVVNGMVSKYPARVGHVIITNTPWFFRFIWAVIRPMLSEQLAAKFHIIPKEEIVQFIDEGSLLPMHGGNSQYDHEEWIRARFEKEGIAYIPP